MACGVRPLGHLARPLLLITVIAAISTDVQAQSYFSCLDGAGNIFNASIIFPAASAPKLGGNALSLGSEIAAFSSDPYYSDQCVGKVVWQNNPAAMAVWGDDDLTPQRDGMMPSDSILLRVWDFATNTEYEISSDDLTYLLGNGIYNHDAALVVSSLTIPAGAAELVAIADLATSNEDTEITVDVLTNDYAGIDPIDPASVEIVVPPTFGTIPTINQIDGSISYLPNPDFNGSDSFSYAIYNVSRSDTSTAIVYLTIDSVNDPPLAFADSATLSEDSIVQIDILGNDTDVDGDEIDASSVSIESAPLNGSITDINTQTGAVTYTPDSDFFGLDSFTYLVLDVSGEASNAVVVSLTVTAANDAPRLENGPIVRGAKNIPYLYEPIFNDPEGELVTITVVTLPGWLSFTDNGDGSATLSGTPSPSEVGDHNVVITASDQSGGVETLNFIVSVAENAPPTVVLDEVNTDEDVTMLIDVLANDTDPENDALDIASLSIVSPPDYGNILEIDQQSGQIVYDPYSDFNGTDSFEYIVSDVNGSVSDPATVVVTIAPVNDAPSATADNASTPEDGSVVIDVLANDWDLDGDLPLVTAVSATSNGTVSINPDESSVTYFPEQDFFGTDSFTYTIRDPDGLTASALATITVDPVNDSPVIASASETIVAPGTLYEYLFSAVDIDGDVLSISAPSLPTWIELNPGENGKATFSGTPEAIDIGLHNVLIEVTDGAITVQQQFTVSVSEITAPLTQAAVATGPAWGALNISVNPRFTWQAVENATNYHLQVSKAQDKEFASPAAEDSTIFPTAEMSSQSSVVYYDLSGLDEGVTYIWRVRARNAGGHSPWSDVSQFTTLGLSTPTEVAPEIPDVAELYQNYPNPFNPSTTIAFDLPATTGVTLTIYDLMGREVDVLVSETLSAGRREVRWDAGDLASGLYLYRLSAGAYVKSKTLSLIK
ncbi:MAG: hypothetical protein BMS9Abin05_1020 [Rhodothermia bacterium]|nr:MAG: hypothetical protein BMS9Abin05_1020 [Rhodothermia bacterium]